jgi:hypothetical protein
MGMQKFLIVTGVLFILAGLAWPLLKKLKLGRLPGDIVIGDGNVKFYFPIVTCIIVSLVLSLIFWLVKK